jgi:hypothetical protein
MKLTDRLLMAGTLGLSVLVLASCSSSSSTPSTTTATTFPIPHAKEPAAPLVTGTTITIDGVTLTVPREEYNPDRPIQALNDQGGQILITDKGVLPQVLLTPVTATITWTNLTTKTVIVGYAKFGTPGYSTPIKPGGHFSLSVTGTGNIPYNTSNRWHGTIAVGQQPMAPIPTTTTTLTPTS